MPRLILCLLVVAAMSGCLLSPLGVNEAPEAIPTPANNQVTLTYRAPADYAGKISFQFVAGEGAEAVLREDDSPDDGYTANFPTSGLAPGMYYVAVFEDGAEEAVAELGFIVPAPAPASAS